MLAGKQKPILEEMAKAAQRQAGIENGGDRKSEEFKKSTVVQMDKSRSAEPAAEEKPKQKLGPQTNEEFEEL